MLVKVLTGVVDPPPSQVAIPGGYRTGTVLAVLAVLAVIAALAVGPLSALGCHPTTGRRGAA